MSKTHDREQVGESSLINARKEELHSIQVNIDFISKINVCKYINQRFIDPKTLMEIFLTNIFKILNFRLDFGSIRSFVSNWMNLHLKLRFDSKMPQWEAQISKFPRTGVDMIWKRSLPNKKTSRQKDENHYTQHSGLLKHSRQQYGSNVSVYP